MKKIWNGDLWGKNEPVRDSIMEDIHDIFKQGEINLNLGCGKNKLDGAINCDLYDPGADKKLDARDLSEYKDGSVNSIYASQLLEHFTEQEGIDALKEWYRVLKFGGHVFLSIPDMEEIIEVATTWDIRKPEIWKAMMKFIYGWQTNEGDVHKWGFCCDSLLDLIRKSGFKMKRIYRGYPRRPTPSLMVVAQKYGFME